MFKILPGDWRTVRGWWQIIWSSCVDDDLMFEASGFTCPDRDTCCRWDWRRNITVKHTETLLPSHRIISSEIQFLVHAPVNSDCKLLFTAF